jgi:hypothetical protein
MNAIRGMALLLGGLLFSGLLPTGGSQSVSAGGEAMDPRTSCGQECQEQLKIAMAATAKYRDPQVAIADGFLGAPAFCGESAEGATGDHWFRPDRFFDTHLDLQAPELLIYLPSGMGWKLGALEWHVPVFVDGVPYYGVTPPDPSKVNPPPVLFGRPFDGPMPGHEPGLPWHYDLHVWAWKHNPLGLFSVYHPDVRCRGGSR